MLTIKYFTFELLKEANDRAIEKKYNRQLTDEFINKLDKNTKFPISYSFTHCDGAVRCIFAYDMKANCAIVDVDPKIFLKLPKAQLPRSKKKKKSK